MKSKLLSAIALPAALAVCAATAMAQDPSPAPSPSQAPAEKMPDATPPSPAPSVTPAPAPEAAPTPAPSSDSSAANESSESKSAAGTFAAAQSADEWRSSKLIGLNVYNQSNEKVGDINDLILGPDGKIANAVIGVGGFLGMGEKLVAVPFSDLTLNRDDDGTHRVTINSSKDALESAPDFKYYSAKASANK
jgi:sporulation protein YlmC with PRC-barrel domain